MEETEPVPPEKVTVTDVDISFSSMVWLLVKFAFAAIPAAAIIGIVVLFVLAVFRGMS